VTVKAFSLWQPWGSLMCPGVGRDPVKSIETRHWTARYRGRVLICSAKKPLGVEAREAIRQIGYAEGGPIWKLTDCPERWLDHHCRICPAGHVSSMGLRTESGDRCLAAGCMKRFLAWCPPEWSDMPLGHVLGDGTLVDVLPMAEATANSGCIHDPDPHLCINGTNIWQWDATNAALDRSDQRPYGHFEPGRYGWVFENLRSLPEPVPIVGRQGLFNPDPTVVAAVDAQFARTEEARARRNGSKRARRLMSWRYLSPQGHQPRRRMQPQGRRRVDDRRRALVQAGRADPERNHMKLTRDEVEAILADWPSHEWQVQGFGMLRTYLDGPGEPRLQVWDQRLACWGNNAVHDHPWAFESTTYAGMLFNQRYRIRPADGTPAAACYTQIVPGTRGGKLSERPVRRCHLEPFPLEVYSLGDRYRQTHRELHLTRYAQGTVTLITRSDREEADIANVAWYGEPEDQPPFVNPYPATDEMCETVIGDALAAWWPSWSTDG
jgi:hypothetical protein